MQLHKILLTVLLIAVSIAGCKDFSNFQSDPNRTTQATPGLILTNLEVAAFNDVSLSSALANRYLVYTDGVSDAQYYGWQRSGFGAYDNLRQVEAMRNEARKVNNENYIALAKFFNAYFTVGLTNTFGDVPYTNALNGTQGEFTPTYDTQKDIYISLLDSLKSASQQLSADGGIINQDLIFEGDIMKWKKLINSFSLRILMSLSIKAGDNDLQLINRFREIVENPGQFPIMESNADNAALPFYDLEGNRYPYYNDNGIQTAYYLEKSFVERLQNREDPRLFALAEPKPNGSDLPANDFDAYGGLQANAPLDVNQKAAVDGEASKIDSRYYEDPVNEPSISLGYPEVQFILAEAAQHGWIDSNPAPYYQNGIEASMAFYGIDEERITAYLQNPAVQLGGNDALQQILTEKHTAFFMNSGWMPFYNQRRTGLPTYAKTGDAMLNNGEIPKRWMYPEREFQYNQTNVEEAVNRQYPNGDTINGEMWLLQE